MKNMEQRCIELRNVIRDTGKVVFALKQHEVFECEGGISSQHKEMIANIMLSYRHLEDARMRLGKVMQQIQGGTSVFDAQENI